MVQQVLAASFLRQLLWASSRFAGGSLLGGSFMKLPGWLWGAVPQWPENLQLKRDILGLIPSGCPGSLLPMLTMYILFQR